MKKFCEALQQKYSKESRSPIYNTGGTSDEISKIIRESRIIEGIPGAVLDGFWKTSINGGTACQKEFMEDSLTEPYRNEYYENVITLRKNIEGPYKKCA